MLCIKYKRLKNEVVLEDSYLVHQGYVYIMDGVVRRSTINGDVGKLKVEMGVQKIRKCSLYGHLSAVIGDEVR